MADVVDSVVGESPLLISRLFGLLFWVLIGLNFILLAFAFDLCQFSHSFICNNFDRAFLIQVLLFLAVSS